MYMIFYNRVYKSIHICLYTWYKICIHIIYIYICIWIIYVYISIYIFCSIQEFFHLWRTFKSPASWGGDSQQLSADSAEPRNESNTQLLLPFCRKLPLKTSYFFWTWIKFCLIQVLVASWFFEYMQAMQAACKRLCLIQAAISHTVQVRYEVSTQFVGRQFSQSRKAATWGSLNHNNGSSFGSW